MRAQHRKLTQKQRMIKSMVEDAGMTVREIASELGLSTQGVYYHVAKAEEKLGRTLKRAKVRQ